jgi:hypothetical protein
VALALINVASLSKWDIESNKFGSNTANFSIGHVCYADISFSPVNYILRSIDYQLWLLWLHVYGRTTL